MSRAPRPRFSDPGGEISDAPSGSVDWAKRMRMELRHVRHNITKEPERFERVHRLGNEHQMWTMLNRSDGTNFESFEEFCSAKEPWGLNSSPEEVGRWLDLTRPCGRLRHVGTVHIDSGTLRIGDPCYLTKNVELTVTTGTGGDGSWDVYAEHDEDGLLHRLVVQLPKGGAK